MNDPIRSSMRAFFARGFCCMTSFAGGSSPSASAGNASVARLIHSNWMGVMTSRSAKKNPSDTTNTSAKFAARRYRTNPCRFW